MKIAAAGDRALLVTFAEVTGGELHAAAAAAGKVSGVIACIQGHASLLVIFDGPTSEHDVQHAVANAAHHPPAPAAQHSIPVSFRDEYAPDLAELLDRAGVGLDAFLERIRQTHLTVRYLGFRGGFAYLDGWPAEWALPRRPTSRPQVVRGSFAIAAAVAGFYPIDSPGGWNILGRTGMALENRFAPGDEIVIQPTMDPVEIAPVSATHSRLELAHVEILAAPLATVATARDWSRVEHGLAPGGPFDADAAVLANRAVGNRESAPLLECALAGPRLRAIDDVVVSWFGAEAPITVDGIEVTHARQFTAKAGQTIAVGRLAHGLRGYLAVGTRYGAVDALSRSVEMARTIHAIRGPHDIGIDVLDCRVTPKLDRVGIRLTQVSPMSHGVPADLPSCGMQCGTLQLHPDGSVVAMGPDHPVTGGYLQPMTVISSELWKLAQLSPGEHVRFVAAHSP